MGLQTAVEFLQKKGFKDIEANPNTKITDEQYEAGKELSMIPYLRILGFRKNATPLLQSIKQHASIPMITKVRTANRQIATNAMWMFEKDLFASDIYRQLIIANKKSVPKNDYSQKLIIL